MGKRIQKGASSPQQSYGVSAPEKNELAVLQDKLRDLVRDTAVFTVHCTGVGVFSGPQPVVYVPVARSPKLGRLHERLWQLIHPLSEDALDYYQPELWFPHITLGIGDINGHNLGPIVQWLNAQELNWTVTVANFSVLGAEQLPHQLQHRFPFAATAS